jgi:hypothetical protein
MAYLGTQPNDVKKNTGLYTPSEILQLTKEGSWGGSLELIEEQTISSSTATVEFTNLANAPYDVYFLTADNVTTDTDDTYLNLQVSNDNGSSYETSNYDYAHQTGTATGTFSEARSTTAGQFFISGNIGTASNEKANCYVYIYNLLSSSKYSFITHQGSDILSSATYRMNFGGGAYHTAETNNAFRLLMNSGNITTANFKLYGVKQI